MSPCALAALDLVGLLAEEAQQRGLAAEDGPPRNLLASAALVVAALLLRWIAVRWVGGVPWARDELRLRWHQRVNQLAITFLVLGLAIVWAPELRSFALSTAALAAATVLATKELIMCASGSLLRTASGDFEVGDRIEVDGLRGDVIRHGLFTTTLLEVGPVQQRTGRAIAFPNSLLLSKAVVNETYTEEYVLHTFAVPLDAETDWRAAEQRLLAIAAEVCEPHVEPTRQRMAELAREHRLTPSVVEPRVSLQLPEPDELRLLVRVPTPARHKGRVEQAILRRFLGARLGAGQDPGAA